VAVPARRVLQVEQRVPAVSLLGVYRSVDAMLETFAEMVERGTSADMIDSTVCGCPLSTMPRTAGIAECKSVCTLRLPPAETIGPVYRP